MGKALSSERVFFVFEIMQHETELKSTIIFVLHSCCMILQNSKIYSKILEIIPRYKKEKSPENSGLPKVYYIIGV